MIKTSFQFEQTQQDTLKIAQIWTLCRYEICLHPGVYSTPSASVRDRISAFSACLITPHYRVNVTGKHPSPRKLEKICTYCVSVSVWILWDGGMLVFRQSCYKHQKHQWAAFSKALQNPLAIMSPSPPLKSLWKLWSRWSPIDCNDSYSDRQEPAGQQSHQSPTAFNDSRRNQGTIAGAASELTVSVQ